MKRGSKSVNLGYFATPEEAALKYARSPEGQAAAAAPPKPPPLTAEEALRQAEAEGLTLLKSESSNTGYRGVFHRSETTASPYVAKVGRAGTNTLVYLGVFATAEEAALVVARSPEGQAAAAAAAAPPEPPPLTAEEALRQAEAEGLTLVRQESSRYSSITGYKGVAVQSGRMKPYQAEVRRGGKSVLLGHFATAEEAALVYARTPEVQAAVAAAAAPPSPPPMTAEEALQQVEAEGLTLLRAESRSTGYKGVTFNANNRPYQAGVRRDGKKAYLGCFATAEEAALVVARTPEARAQVADEARLERHFDVVEGILFASAPSSNGKRRRVSCVGGT